MSKLRIFRFGRNGSMGSKASAATTRSVVYVPCSRGSPVMRVQAARSWS